MVYLLLIGSVLWLAYRTPANWRSRGRQLPFGDQGIFLRRETFRSLGGYAEWPILEDVVLVSALQKRGRIAIAPGAAVTSARRWIQRGVWRTTLAHKRILLGWRLGYDPARLATWRKQTPFTPTRQRGLPGLPEPG